MQALSNYLFRDQIEPGKTGDTWDILNADTGMPMAVAKNVAVEARLEWPDAVEAGIRPEMILGLGVAVLML